MTTASSFQSGGKANLAEEAKASLSREAEERDLQVRGDIESFFLCTSDGASTTAKIYQVTYQFQEQCKLPHSTKIPHSFSIISAPRYKSKMLEVFIICHSHTEKEDSPEKRSLRNRFQQLCAKTFPGEGHTTHLVSDHIFRKGCVGALGLLENPLLLKHDYDEQAPSQQETHACFVHARYTIASQPPFLKDEQLFIYLIPTESSEVENISYIPLPTGPVQSKDNRITALFNPLVIQEIYADIQKTRSSPLMMPREQKTSPSSVLIQKLKELAPQSQRTKNTNDMLSLIS